MTVLDLASRFADGRLSTEKLLEANDEDLASMLLEVRGIGRVSHPRKIRCVRHSDRKPVLHSGPVRSPGLSEWDCTAQLSLS